MTVKTFYNAIGIELTSTGGIVNEGISVPM